MEHYGGGSSCSLGLTVKLKKASIFAFYSCVVSAEEVVRQIVIGAGCIFALVLVVMTGNAIDRIRYPAKYAELDRVAAEHAAIRDAEIAARDAAKNQALAEESRKAALQPELHAAILDMTAARVAYPATGGEAEFRAYNARLASSIRRWERAQEAVNGPNWRAKYVADNRLSSCGLNGGDRLACMNAPMDFSSIPTVENSMVLIQEEVAAVHPVESVAVIEQHQITSEPVVQQEAVAVITTTSPQPGSMSY